MSAVQGAAPERLQLLHVLTFSTGGGQAWEGLLLGLLPGVRTPLSAFSEGLLPPAPAIAALGLTLDY